MSNPCMPLRYRISDWHQLPSCRSNNSRQLHIHVADIVQDARLSGIRITLNHDDFGTLFACVVNSSGTLLSVMDNAAVYEFTPSQILEELKKYGYLITYCPAEHLKGDQLQFLMTIRDLHFDKIRVINTWDSITDLNKEFTWCVVAFQAAANPYWLNNDYSPSKLEFNKALESGTAFNISNVSKAQKFNWSWLVGWVGDIDDILRENAK